MSVLLQKPRKVMHNWKESRLQKKTTTGFWEIARTLPSLTW